VANVSGVTMLFGGGQRSAISGSGIIVTPLRIKYCEIPLVLRVHVGIHTVRVLFPSLSLFGWPFFSLILLGLWNWCSWMSEGRGPG